MRLPRIIAVATLAALARVSAHAQDCASSPLLGRRAAIGVDAARASTSETSAGAALGVRVFGSLRAAAEYRAARLQDVDRLQHAGAASVALPVERYGIELCPSAEASLAHLNTSTTNSSGHVTTTQSRLGLELAHSFTLPHTVRVSPFVEPAIERAHASWESFASTWRVADTQSETSAQLSYGVALATSRTAIVARVRTAHGGERTELGLAVVRAFGSR